MKSGKASKSKKKDKSKAKQDKNKKKKKKGHPSPWNPVNRVIAVACGNAGSSSARSKSRSSTSLSEASSEACFDEAQHLFGLKVKDLQRQSGQPGALGRQTAGLHRQRSVADDPGSGHL